MPYWKASSDCIALTFFPWLFLFHFLSFLFGFKSRLWYCCVDVVLFFLSFHLRRAIFRRRPPRLLDSGFPRDQFNYSDVMWTTNSRIIIIIKKREIFFFLVFIFFWGGGRVWIRARSRTLGLRLPLIKTHQPCWPMGNVARVDRVLDRDIRLPRIYHVFVFVCLFFYWAKKGN